MSDVRCQMSDVGSKKTDPDSRFIFFEKSAQASSKHNKGLRNRSPLLCLERFLLFA